MRKDDLKDICKHNLHKFLKTYLLYKKDRYVMANDLPWASNTFLYNSKLGAKNDISLQ